MEGFDDFFWEIHSLRHFIFSFKNFQKSKNVYFWNFGLKSMPDNIRALTKHNVTQNASCFTKEWNLFLSTHYAAEELFWKKILNLLPTVLAIKNSI